MYLNKNLSRPSCMDGIEEYVLYSVHASEYISTPAPKGHTTQTLENITSIHPLLITQHQQIRLPLSQIQNHLSK